MLQNPQIPSVVGKLTVSNGEELADKWVELGSVVKSSACDLEPALGKIGKKEDTLKKMEVELSAKEEKSGGGGEELITILAQVRENLQGVEAVKSKVGELKDKYRRRRRVVGVVKS